MHARVIHVDTRRGFSTLVLFISLFFGIAIPTHFNENVFTLVMTWIIYTCRLFNNFTCTRTRTEATSAGASGIMAIYNPSLLLST